MGGLYRLKLNLMKMRNAALQELKVDESTTKQCVIIPVEDNKIFVSEKTGSAYVDFDCIPRKKMQFFQSHLVKLRYPEDEFAQLTLEEANDLKTIGSLSPVKALRKEWKNKNKGSYDPKEPESNIAGTYHQQNIQSNNELKQNTNYNGWNF